jgi:tRNA modification GTPase
MDLTGADTIAAVSTPPGEAGVGIVRLSGPEAVAIAGKLFESPGGRRLISHRVLYGFIKDPETGERVEEVLLTFMRAPRSYTREDVVEINCHGGMVPVRRTLELTLRQGARLAEPGEFTRRAFLNGRIDLSQAEATLDIIRAKTAAAGKLALGQLRGDLSGKINALKERLLEACAHLEACIDFPEEEIEPRSMREIMEGMKGVRDEISALSGSFEEGRFFREGLRTAIVGRPNVGKSSLLNALLMRDRAIVTDTPGTTRDVIEEYLNINGLPLKVMDTAGIRETHGMAEREGVRRSLMALEDSDLVLAVLDGSALPTEDDEVVVERTRGKNSLLLINKTDLPAAFGSDHPLVSGAGARVLKISARTGRGLDELKDAVYNSSVSAPAGVMVTNLRHKTALDAGAGALGAALESIGKMPVEITAMELREALDRLGEIVGHVSTDEILQRIFSEFCIGK